MENEKLKAARRSEWVAGIAGVNIPVNDVTQLLKSSEFLTVKHGLNFVHTQASFTKDVSAMGNAERARLCVCVTAAPHF